MSDMPFAATCRAAQRRYYREVITRADYMRERRHTRLCAMLFCCAFDMREARSAHTVARNALRTNIHIQ